MGRTLSGLNAVLAALENFPNLEEVISDMGYTQHGKDFVRPLHQMGINVVMDYPEKHQQKIEVVTIEHGNKKRTLLFHCGLVGCLPPPLTWSFSRAFRRTPQLREGGRHNSESPYRLWNLPVEETRFCQSGVAPQPPGKPWAIQNSILPTCAILLAKPRLDSLFTLRGQQFM